MLVTAAAQTWNVQREDVLRKMDRPSQSKF
jgi:hypothetical protein